MTMAASGEVEFEHQPGVSVVVAVYNGAALLSELIVQLEPALQRTGLPYELVLVDDGSRDASWREIERAAREKSWVRGVKLNRNCGQQIAVSAGISQATREYIAIMDCDLQNPPSAIPELVERLKAGDDIVYTISKIRNGRVDRFTSQLFWLILTKFLRVDIIKDQLMMRGMSSRFARLYASYPEITRTVAGFHAISD